MKKIETIKDMKKSYPELFKILKEKMKENHAKISHFELDYFVIDKKNHTYYITLSSGIGEDLETFDMNGEILGDEISVNNVSFEQSSKSDFFDSQSAFIREMLSDEEDDHDVEY